MRSYRRTTLLTVACVSVLSGLALSRNIYFAENFWLLLLLPLLFVARKKNIIALLAIIVVGLGLGIWRGSIYSEKLSDIQTLAGQKVTIQVSTTSDSIYGNAAQMEFTANKVTQNDRPLAGNFKISGFGEPMIYRGDRVEVTGKVYPSHGSNQARLSYAELERIGQDNNWINDFVRRLGAGMHTALPEPNASFGLGLLIGQRNNLPDDFNQQLLMVGLVHIVAVSGYNLTIIVRAISRLKLGSRYQRLLMSLILIGIFILMTGFSPSIVRAAIVAALGLWAWYYGNKFKPLLLIGLAAVITAFANPFYIWGDLGWYLSFLAFFGVLVVAPAATKKLFRKEPKLLTLVVVETLCAEIMTLPLILMSFGQLSLIGLVANALVVPLIPLAMLLCAAAAAGGMWLPALSGWIAWPANLLMTYIVDIIKLLSSIPGLFLHKSISSKTMIYCYGLVVILLLVLHRRRSEDATITDKNLAIN